MIIVDKQEAIKRLKAKLVQNEASRKRAKEVFVREFAQWRLTAPAKVTAAIRAMTLQRYMKQTTSRYGGGRDYMARIDWPAPPGRPAEYTRGDDKIKRLIKTLELSAGDTVKLRDADLDGLLNILIE